MSINPNSANSASHHTSHSPTFGTLNAAFGKRTHRISRPAMADDVSGTGYLLDSTQPPRPRSRPSAPGHKPVNPLDGLDEAVGKMAPDEKSKKREKQNQGNRQGQNGPPESYAARYSATVEHPYSTGNMADNPDHPLMASVRRSMESGSQGGMAGIPARPIPPMLPSPARKVITLDPAMIDRIGEVR